MRLRCVRSQDGQDLHKQAMSHDISHISSACYLSSLEFFLLLHYRQAKCIIYCLTLNPAHGFIFMTNAAIQKIKESVACKQNKTPLYFQLHIPRYVRRFKREQMPSLISFRGVFNSKVWFLWLLINPYPVYLQTKYFSYQNRFHIPFWMVIRLYTRLYTLNSL